MCTMLRQTSEAVQIWLGRFRARWSRISIVAGLFAASGVVSAQGVDTWPTYQTDGHPKSNGINLSIRYPPGWTANEGERPHIVQKFVAPDRKAYAVIAIQEVPPGTTMTREEIQAAFVPSELRLMIPENMRMVDVRETQVEGLPAGILEYQGTTQTAGTAAALRAMKLMFFYDRSLVSIQFAVTDLPSASNLSSGMETHKPTFLSMANSVVLRDLWTRAAAPSVGTGSLTAHPSASAPPSGHSTMRSLFGDNWPATVLVSFLITWGIGLAPPLLVRFALLHRPMTKNAALGLVLLFWVMNLVVFTAMGSQSKTHGVLGLIAMVSYFILRKGAKEPAAA